MHSDYWMRQGYHCGNRIKVTDIVNYQVWTDDNSNTVGVTVNYETADDFHYELRTADWNHFLTEVLFVSDTAVTAYVFRDYLLHHPGLFAFEEAMKSIGIAFKKVAFY